jgi:uncharacterized protein involved in exopolysaccharide biosynthesis
MLVSVIQLVKRGWRAMLTIFLAVSLISILAAWLIPKVYEGDVLISYNPVDQTGSKLASLAGQFGGLAALAGVDLTPSTDDRPEALATIASRQFSVEFMEQHHLLPILFPDAWDAAGNRWKVAADEIPTMADAFKLFDEHVRSVNDDKSTGLITVSIRSKQREHVAEWANALVSESDTLLRKRALRDSQFAVTFLQKELTENDLVEVRQAISQVLQQQISTLALANGRKEYAFKVIDPAVTPDPDLFVWPNRPLIIVLGLAFGLALGFSYVLIREDIAKGE